MSKLHYITYFGMEHGRPELLSATLKHIRFHVDVIHVCTTYPEHTKTEAIRDIVCSSDHLYLGTNAEWPLTGDMLRHALNQVPDGDWVIWGDSDERPECKSLHDVKLAKEFGEKIHFVGEENRLDEGLRSTLTQSTQRFPAFFKTDKLSIRSTGSHTHIFPNCSSASPNHFQYYHFKSRSLFAQSTFLFFLADPENHAVFDAHGHASGWNKECYEQWKPIQERHGASNLDVVGEWNLSRSVPRDVKKLLWSWMDNPDVPGHMNLIADYVFKMQFQVTYPQEFLTIF